MTSESRDSRVSLLVTLEHPVRLCCGRCSPDPGGLPSSTRLFLPVGLPSSCGRSSRAPLIRALLLP